jgi:hypothetical protein
MPLTSAEARQNGQNIPIKIMKILKFVDENWYRVHDDDVFAAICECHDLCTMLSLYELADILEEVLGEPLGM